MKQLKRWMAPAAVAVALAALAIPAVASASRVESSPGVLTKVGSYVRLKNVGNVIFTTSTWGPWICEYYEVEGELTENSGSSIKAGPHGEGTTSACTNNGNPVTVTKLQLTSLTSTETGVGKASFTTTEDVAGLTCAFTGTNVPFTYAEKGATIVFSSAAGIKSSPAGCGTQKLSATFELTVGGTPVILN